MQTLVAPSERVFNAFMLHCSASMIRARVCRGGGRCLEYPEVVCELCKEGVGTQEEIINSGIEKAIAWFAEKDDYTIDYAHEWLIKQTEAFYQKIIKECQNERELQLSVQSVEDLLLKPLRRKIGGQI